MENVPLAIPSSGLLWSRCFPGASGAARAVAPRVPLCGGSHRRSRQRTHPAPWGYRAPQPRCEAQTWLLPQQSHKAFSFSLVRLIASPCLTWYIKHYLPASKTSIPSALVCQSQTLKDYKGLTTSYPKGLLDYVVQRWTHYLGCIILNAISFIYSQCWLNCPPFRVSLSASLFRSQIWNEVL